MLGLVRFRHTSQALHPTQHIRQAIQNIELNDRAVFVPSSSWTCIVLVLCDRCSSSINSCNDEPPLRQMLGAAAACAGCFKQTPQQLLYCTYVIQEGVPNAIGFFVVIPPSLRLSQLQSVSHKHTSVINNSKAARRKVSHNYQVLLLPACVYTSTCTARCGRNMYPLGCNTQLQFGAN